MECRGPEAIGSSVAHIDKDQWDDGSHHKQESGENSLLAQSGRNRNQGSLVVDQHRLHPAIDQECVGNGMREEFVAAVVVPIHFVLQQAVTDLPKGVPEQVRADRGQPLSKSGYTADHADCPRTP